MPTANLPTELILRELMRNRAENIIEAALAALAARKAVLRSAGECCELIHETYCVSDAFSFTGKLGQGFIHIATYAGHVNVGFNRGTELDDPDRLLLGTGKLIRHLRLSGASDLKQKSIKRLIDLAVVQGHEMAERNGGTQPARVVVHRSAK